MNKNFIDLQIVEMRRTAFSNTSPKKYVAPDIEVIDIEIGQNILNGSTGDDYGKETWAN